MRTRRTAGAVLTMVGVAAVLGLTLYPVPDEAEGAAATPLLCLVCGVQGGADILANLLLTLPLGLGVRLATGSPRAAVLATAVLSLTVELLQLTVVPGRDASLSDVVSNTAGGALGAWVGAHLRPLLQPAPAAAWRLLLAGALAGISLLGLSAWLQQPLVRETSAGARGAPVIRHAPAFTGRLTRVTVDGVTLRPEGLGEINPERRRGSAGRRVTVDLDLVTGRRAGGRRIVFSPGGNPPRLEVAQQGRSALFSPPSRAAMFRLRPPVVRLERGFPDDSGVAVTLHAAAAGGTLHLASAYAGERRAVSLALGPAHGWVLVAPFGLSRADAITSALLGAALLALGYWARGSGRGLWAAAVLVSVLALGLGLVPAAGGYRPVAAWQWLAGAAGALAGWALHRGAAYLQLRCGSRSASVSSSS